MPVYYTVTPPVPVIHLFFSYTLSSALILLAYNRSTTVTFVYASDSELFLPDLFGYPSESSIEPISYLLPTGHFSEASKAYSEEIGKEQEILCA